MGAGAPLVYLPQTVSQAKAEKLAARGANIVLFGDDTIKAELEARRIAEERGMTFVSPYNDNAVRSPHTPPCAGMSTVHGGHADSACSPPNLS
jgi:threonine dehydratase